jgi:integrase
VAVFTRPDRPKWFFMYLEGYGKKRERIPIRADAVAPKVRKANREAAEAIYHARMTQLAKRPVGLPSTVGETFERFSAWYDTNHIETHRGKARERVILKHLRGYFNAFKLTEITKGAWTEYATTRRNAGVSVNTIGRELALMKSILVEAVGEHIEVSPLAHVKRKTERLPPKRTLTKADETTLLKELHDPEIHDLYILGIGTLFREQNLIHLRRRDVHGSRLVALTKTGPHHLDLSGPTSLQTRALTMLQARWPKKPDDYFFPTWQARFAKNRDSGNAFFLKVVRRAVIRAGLPWGLKHQGVVWHTMTRASGATRMLREFKIDVRTVQLLGGWRSLDQMAEYLGLDLTKG